MSRCGMWMEDPDAHSRPGPEDREGRPGPEDREGRPGPEDREGRPGLEDREGRPGPEDREGRPGPEDSEGRPGPEDREGRPGPEDREGRPGPEDREGRPGPEDREGRPGPEDSEGRPGPEDREGRPGPEDREGRPGPEDREGRPGPEDSEGRPGPEDSEGRPGPEDSEGRPGPEGRGSRPGPEGRGSRPGPEDRGSRPGPEDRGSRPGPEDRGSRPGPEDRGSRPGPEDSEGQPGPEDSEGQPGPEDRGSRPGPEDRGSRPGPEGRGSRPGPEASEGSEGQPGPEPRENSLEQTAYRRQTNQEADDRKEPAPMKDKAQGKRQRRQANNNRNNQQYYGLKNQGSTCYLNCILQTLFMTKDFREAVKSSEKQENFIDGELAALFDVLEHQTATTHGLTEKLGIHNVHEQQDAAEFLERILGLTSKEASKIFHGQLVHRTSCQECLKKTDNDGAFWCLPLPLVGSRNKEFSVIEGIQEFFKKSSFSGENQMYCESCDKKVDADTQYAIKHHPDILILPLKRFDFSYQYMSYVKINRTVEVPHILRVPESQMYELYAFVKHFGDLRSGHYATNIKIQDGTEEDKWFNFSDAHVSQLCPQTLKKDTEQSESAYVLFYRKTTTHAADPSINNDLPSTESKHNDQSQEKDRKKEEEAAEVGEIPVTVPIDPNTGRDRKVGRAKDEDMREDVEGEDKSRTLPGAREKTPDQEARDRNESVDINRGKDEQSEKEQLEMEGDSLEFSRTEKQTGPKRGGECTGEQRNKKNKSWKSRGESRETELNNSG